MRMQPAARTRSTTDQPNQISPATCRRGADQDDSGSRCRRKDDQMQTTDDQRAQLAAAGAMLTELAGYAQKIATGAANPCEERRAAELAADARSAVQKCAAILRSMTN